jgi:hypothetical protein
MIVNTSKKTTFNATIIILKNFKKHSNFKQYLLTTTPIRITKTKHKIIFPKPLTTSDAILFSWLSLVFNIWFNELLEIGYIGKQYFP